jgi:catechol 2,3-dioxygenase-like lactoylglutathione lyase family enzyme
MDWRIEVITLPVTDVDRAIAFYTDQLGFVLDVDYQPDGRFRVVQITPPGSACSIQLVAADGVPDAAVAAATGRSIYLVVRDVEAARESLVARGVSVSAVRHKSPRDAWAGDWETGLDPDRRDYASFADFADPDGNVWILQERGFGG